MADDMPAPGRFSGLRLGRSTWTLTFCQALYFAGVSVDLTLTAIVGLALAPTPELATVPLATILITGTLCSVGAGLLAARIGYPKVMILGASAAVIGGCFSAYAITTGSFWVLCFGTGLVGAYRSTGGYIRYMAADLAPEGHQDQALSFILYGGLVAAFAGPFAATASADLIQPQYTSAYLLVAMFALGNILLIATMPTKPCASDDTCADVLEERPTPVAISSVTRNPDFRLGLIALAGSGALMTMVMAIGPLASHHAGHSMADGAFMIQWHMVGMFAPAIISGQVMARLGARVTGLVGAAVIAAGAVCGLLGISVLHLLVSLALNGIGWNFLFPAGSSLVIRTYPVGRGGRIQALAEGLAAVTGVAASLSASTIFLSLGWQGTNAPVLAAALLVLLLIVVVGRHPAKIADDVGTFRGQTHERARMQLDQATICRQHRREAGVIEQPHDPIGLVRGAFNRSPAVRGHLGAGGEPLGPGPPGLQRADGADHGHELLGQHPRQVPVSGAGVDRFGPAGGVEHLRSSRAVLSLLAAGSNQAGGLEPGEMEPGGGDREFHRCGHLPHRHRPGGLTQDGQHEVVASLLATALAAPGHEASFDQSTRFYPGLMALISRTSVPTSKSSVAAFVMADIQCRSHQ